MNFDEFKQRYAKKLVSTGLFDSAEDALNDEGFNDRMAELYLGLMVYAEYQNEEAQKRYEKMQKEAKAKVTAEKKPGIYVPGRHH